MQSLSDRMKFYTDTQELRYKLVIKSQSLMLKNKITLSEVSRIDKLIESELYEDLVLAKEILDTLAIHDF